MKITTTTHTGGFLLPACGDAAAAAAYRARRSVTVPNSTLVRPRGASG